MIEKTNKRILILINEKIDRLIKITSEHTKEEIESNYLYFDTIQYEFEKIYQDSAKLSAAFFLEYPSFPYKELRSIRNRIAHDYESVVLEILIDTIINDFPRFKGLIETIIAEVDN